MANNFPDNVTGNEYEISGPHYEKESDILCGECGSETMELGWGDSRWLECTSCKWWDDIEEDPGDDPDRKYDEERDRRMLGIDRPDELDNTSE